MRVAVAGLWHLGVVTAACCGQGGHDVTAFDEDSAVIDELRKGRLPVDEPGLTELTASVVRSGRLRFTSFGLRFRFVRTCGIGFFFSHVSRSLNLASFRVRIANYAHCLARAFTRPRIC